MLKLGFKGLKFGYETSPEISNFMTIRHVGAELFHSDGRTHKTKLIFAFRYVSNAPKNSTFCPHTVFICFVRISQRTAIISLYNTN